MEKAQYQQKSGQGCLPICLAMLAGISPNQIYEQNMLSKGLFMYKQNYALGMAAAFVQEYGCPDIKVRLRFIHPHYARRLALEFAGCNVEIDHIAFDELVWCPQRPPYIINVDMFELGWYEHQPHYIVVQSRTAKMAIIHDPWTGKSRRVTIAKLAEAIRSLRDYIRVCPVIIDTIRP